MKMAFDLTKTAFELTVKRRQRLFRDEEVLAYVKRQRSKVKKLKI